MNEVPTTPFGVGGSSAGGDRVVAHVTCLGCGCACDDIDVRVEGERIVNATRACSLGLAWFGDGAVPARARVDGRDTTVDEALDATARLLSESESPIVYLAPELSCEAQREGVALADALRATLDSVTSDTVLPWVLASQERGWTGATLGEIRNRGDVIVFWGVDPALRYPRFTTRYAPDPVGVHLPEGRRSRTVVAVDVTPAGDANIGTSRGPADADVRVSLRASDEVAVLVAIGALVRESEGDDLHRRGRDGVVWDVARQIAPLLLRARYAVVVHDTEPVAGREAARVEGLIAMTHAMNRRTRCALSTLRAGGNRSGAESVMTSQTGFPATIDFARGVPRYRPHDGSAMVRLHSRADGRTGGRVQKENGGANLGIAVLVIGAVAQLPAGVLAAFDGVRCALIGPRASECGLGSAAAVIDTGVAGIHTGGTALRMDEVPLPLRPSIVGPPDPTVLIRQLHQRIARAPLAVTATPDGAR